MQSDTANSVQGPEKEQLKQNIVIQKLQMVGLKKKQQRQMLRKKQSTLHGILTIDPELEGEAFGLISVDNTFR
jgi:hypothetical protein